MKRDMDLIRQILFKVEEAPTFDKTIKIAIDGYDSKTIAYHALLLADAGYIVAGRNNLFAHRLTWQGHEFLEAAKDDARWDKAKSAMKASGGMVAEVLKSLLISWMNQAILGQTKQNP